MDNENKLTLSKIVENIISASFNIVSDALSLVIAEAELAKQSAVKMLFLLFFTALLVITVWAGLQGLIIVYLVSINISLLLSLAIVTVFNIFLMVITVVAIMRLKRNLHFKATRRVFGISKELLKDSSHE